MANWHTGAARICFVSGEDVFLDDIRVCELEKTLQVPINIVKSSGYDFVKVILGK